jgi:heavy-metal resistance protein
MFNKSKAWAVSLLVAVAVVGLVAGAATERWVASDGSRGGRATYSDYLTRQLQLSASQHDSVVAILRRHQPELHALFQTIRPQVDSARARVADEIRGILTPAQRESYQRLLDRDRAERARADSAAAAQAKKP